MKITTNDRELICLLIAVNGLQPETSQSLRKRKTRAFEQLQLERIEALALPGCACSAIHPAQYPTDAVDLEGVESATRDFLIEKFGDGGEVKGGSFVERTVCRFIERIRAIE